MRVLLTGTSGRLGSRVFKSILDHDLIPTTDLAISTTSPHKLYAIAKQNDIPIVLGDFKSPVEELAAEFAASEADILLLVPFSGSLYSYYDHYHTHSRKGSVSHGAESHDEERLQQYRRNAIDAARVSGCIKLVVMVEYITTARHDAQLQTMRYLEQEKEKQGGIDYMVLNVGVYAEDWWLYCGIWNMEPGLGESMTSESDVMRQKYQSRQRQQQEQRLGSITEEDGRLIETKFSNGEVEKDDEQKDEEEQEIEVVIPCDGPIAWVSLEDVAEGVAKIVSRLAHGEREWAGRTLNLTGSQTATVADIANLVTQYRDDSDNSSAMESQRRINMELVGKQEAKTCHMHHSAIDERFLNHWTGLYDAVERGDCAVADPLLSEVLDREVDGIEELVKE